jgi:hypothetical protein
VILMNEPTINSQKPAAYTTRNDLLHK